MNILITGANGQLGRELSIHGNNQNHHIFETDLPDLDITRYNDIQKHFDFCKPDIIVNSSAYTNVDKSESDSEIAFAVNKEGPSNLAKICREYDIPLIHVSTDYVFDGQKGSAYFETDKITPLGIYGASKEAGESEIRKHHDKHIILRTSWLYGVYGHNFVKTMLKIGKEHETLKVVADQKGCPTCAEDLAIAIFTILTHIKDKKYINWGTYHYCNQGIISWHEFSEKIFQIAKKYDSFKVKKILPIPTEDYPTPAKRPAYSALNCEKIESNFDICLVSWQKSLERTIEQLYKISPTVSQ